MACCCKIASLPCGSVISCSAAAGLVGCCSKSRLSMLAAPSHLLLLQLLLWYCCCPTCGLGHKGSLVFSPAAAVSAGAMSWPALRFSSQSTEQLLTSGLLRHSLTPCLPASHWQPLYSPRLLRDGACPQPCCCLRKLHPMLQIGNLAEAETAFARGLDLGSSDRQAVQALRVLAHMKQGCGEHGEAVKVLTRALDVGVRDQMVQCHFLRGGLLVCNLRLAVSLSALRLLCCMRMQTYNSLQQPAAARQT